MFGLGVTFGGLGVPLGVQLGLEDLAELPLGVALGFDDLIEHGNLAGDVVGLHGRDGQAGELVVVVASEALWRGAFHWGSVELE